MVSHTSWSLVRDDALRLCSSQLKKKGKRYDRDRAESRIESSSSQRKKNCCGRFSSGLLFFLPPSSSSSFVLLTREQLGGIENWVAQKGESWVFKFWRCLSLTTTRQEAIRKKANPDFRACPSVDSIFDFRDYLRSSILARRKVNLLFYHDLLFV